MLPPHSKHDEVRLSHAVLNWPNLTEDDFCHSHAKQGYPENEARHPLLGWITQVTRPGPHPALPPKSLFRDVAHAIGCIFDRHGWRGSLNDFNDRCVSRGEQAKLVTVWREARELLRGRPRWLRSRIEIR